jgi:hypothetical protein
LARPAGHRKKLPTTVAHRITFESDHPSTKTRHKLQSELHRNHPWPAFAASMRLCSRRTLGLIPECSLGQQISDPDDKAGRLSTLNGQGNISPTRLTRGTQHQACLKWGKNDANQKCVSLLAKPSHSHRRGRLPHSLCVRGSAAPPALSSELRLTHRIHCQMRIAQYTFGRTVDTMLEALARKAGLFLGIHSSYPSYS